MDQVLNTHCATLELSGVIDDATVKAAYRRQIKQWHPDRYHDDPAMRLMAEEKAKRLNTAYEWLTEALERGGLPSSTDFSGKQGMGFRGASQGPRHVYRRKPFTPGFADASVFEVFVKSSNIISTGYSRLARIMYIKFHDGATYRYFDVPLEVFDAFLAAESHGAFAHRRIYSMCLQERC